MLFHLLVLYDSSLISVKDFVQLLLFIFQWSQILPEEIAYKHEVKY